MSIQDKVDYTVAQKHSGAGRRVDNPTYEEYRGTADAGQAHPSVC